MLRRSSRDAREQSITCNYFGPPDKVQHQLEKLEWVEQAWVRLREDGDVLTGEAFVVPRNESQLLDRLKEARAVAKFGRLAPARH